MIFELIFIVMMMNCCVNGEQQQQQQQQSNLTFSWNNCGSASDLLSFQAMTLNPDQVHLPGNTIVGGTVHVLKHLPAQISAHVDMHAKILGEWVHVPCEGSAGSCSYNLCSNKTYLNESPKRCPPLPPAIYSISNFLQHFKSGLPIKVSDQVKMDINIDSDYAGHIGCIHIQVDVKT